MEDRRPERAFYPAPYTVAHARLVPVPDDATRLVRPDGAEVPGPAISLLAADIICALA